MRPVISERNSVENTARNRPTATISSAMVAVRTLTRGIFSWRFVPNSPGLTCRQMAREPNAAPVKSARTTTVRKMSFGQRNEAVEGMDEAKTDRKTFGNTPTGLSASRKLRRLRRDRRHD
jgi:hypothetical protein